MAQQIKITMKENNGTDFDTLYPQTVSNQVIMQDENGALTNKTLDDRVNEIATDGDAFQVGDTLTTARTNLGDKWLLCNGEIVTDTQQPELANVVEFKSLQLSFQSNAIIANIDENGRTSYSASGLSRAPNECQTFFDGINGYFYQCSAWYYFNTTTGVRITTSDLTSLGTAAYDAVGYYGRLFKCGDYLIQTTRARYTPLYKLIGGTSWENTANQTGITNVSCVAYFNGKYYFARQSQSYDYDPRPGLAVSNSPDGSNYTYIAYPNAAYNNTLIGAISVANGHLFVSSSLSHNLAYLSDDGTTLNTVNGTGAASGTAVYVVYANNKYYLSCTSGVYMVTDIFNPTDMTKIYSKSTSSELRMYQIGNKILLSDGYYINEDNTVSSNSLIEGATNVFADVNGEDVVITAIYKKDSKYFAGVYKTTAGKAFTLPNISLADNLYTYIKVKS